MGGPGSGRPGGQRGSLPPPATVTIDALQTPNRDRLLEAIAPVVVIPENTPPPIPLPATLNAKSRDDHDISVRRVFEQENIARNLTWLLFCGLADAEIARRTGHVQHTIANFRKSDRYHALAESMRAEMLARVDEAMRERLQEVVMEAVELKIFLMRNAAKETLRNQIASELIDLGKAALQIGRGNVSDLLRAIHEQAVKEKGNGTRTTTERVTLEGSPAAVAAATASLRQRNDGSNGGGEAAWTDDRAGSGGGIQRPPETADAAGGPGSDTPDGDSGVQPA